MYHGLHPNANPLQQTYDQLQNRAIQELNDEIVRLKEIITDKDGEIVKLKEITNQGTLQKKLANVLEENNNLKLQLKEYENNKQRIKELTESLNSKNDEIYRENEKMNLLNDEYKEVIDKNAKLNEELAEKSQMIQANKQKDDEIAQLNKKLAEFKNLIHDLKNATKVNHLESSIEQMKQQINTIQHEKQILSENNKHLSTIYDEMKAKYTKLLNDFDKNVEQNQFKMNKHIESINDDRTALKQKYDSEKNKNAALKTQMKELQRSFGEMEALNLKLIKGYNIEDVVNDLQHAKNQNINLQNELKQITKAISQKEKTNLVLLNRNKVLTQTLSVAKHQDLMSDIDLMNDEESTHFDHIEEIQSLQQNIQNLHKKIDKLESDKYKLLTQLHESNDGDDSDENAPDSLAFSGLNTQQRNKIKHFVQKIRKQSLMPMDVEEDDDDHDRIQILKKENQTLREWKDSLMTKLFETQQVNAANTMNTVQNKEEVEVNDSTKDILFDIVSKEKLHHLLAVNNDSYCAEIKESIDDHKEYIDVVLQVLDDESLQNVQNIEILVKNDSDRDALCQLRKANDALNDEIDTLKGYKLRHAKIETILKQKDESELIKKVDHVSKENMVLIVNQKKLSKKYLDLKKQQKYLFIQYKKLLHYLMETEKYLWHKLSITQHKNESLSIFINGLMQNISNKMVPLDEYKNIEIECQSLYQTKDHLLSILHRFETFSLQYFQCKRDKIRLEHQLIDKQPQNKEENEVIHNAELVEDDDNKPQIKASIKTTQDEYERTRKKYEHAMCEIKELETNSAKLHDQITELRTICLEQSDTISSLKKQLNDKDHCATNPYNELQARFDKLKVEYDTKVVEIEQMKQKTEFAVSSLQTLQTKIISALDVDGDAADDDDNGSMHAIEEILKKTQNVKHTEAVNKQTMKSMQDKICSLEVEILKTERKYSELQSQHFNTQKAKRFLEANFNCVYSKTLHKMSTKYLSEIDHLRHTNEELYEYLNEEQTKTKDIYHDMVDHKIIIESFKVKLENMNVLMRQYEDGDFNDNESTKKYVKNWQNKCTNLEIKQIELLNNNESQQNEIAFLRNENKKYIANIGSLQKKLSLSHQEIQDTKHEMIKKYNAYQIEALQEKIEIETESKSVQTQFSNSCDDDDDDKEKMEKLQSKVVSLQNLIRTLQNESIHTEERVNGATEGLQIMLKTAQETIKSLQTLVVQKNESIEEYKHMMDKLLKKLKEQQAKYAQHIRALKIKHNQDQKENEEMITAQMKDEQHQISHNEWIQFSEMKTSMQQKEILIKELQQRNAKIMTDQEENETKIEILNTRIDEYHQVIQELNEKVLNLSDSLRAFKTKLSAKKKENLHLQKAVKTLKENMEKKREQRRNERNHEDEMRNEEEKDNEMDDKMRKIENEYKELRSSLRSELDENTQKLNETQWRKKQLMTKNNDLIREVEKLKNNLMNKSGLIHKLQLQISKIQKDKITIQEKHSVALKINKKKINHLEKTVHSLEKKAECDESQMEHFKKKVDEKQGELNRAKTAHQKVIKMKKTQQKEMAQLKKEIETMRDEMEEMKKTKVNLNENENENKNKKELESLEKEILKLQMENKRMKRKYDLVTNDENKTSDKEIAKLFDEIESKENLIIDLETKINELNFEKQDLEIKYKKIENRKLSSAAAQNKVISSRNDPQLQNLLDSMRFIINKLKKENQTLKDKQKNEKQSLRISNLLKENKNLKKKMNETQYSENMARELEQKQLEIEGITNLNKRLKKENMSLKERNAKYIKSDSVKKEQEITHLKKIIEEERNILSQRVNETEMIWKRKISITNDDLSRYKKIKKDLESEVKHKNDINQKMCQEIKALIELIDHTKNVSNQQNENEKKANKQIKQLKKENDELRSELSAFDVSFFNEIEDLKYREAQAQQIIIELQQKLKQ